MRIALLLIAALGLALPVDSPASTLAGYTTADICATCPQPTGDSLEILAVSDNTESLQLAVNGVGVGINLDVIGSGVQSLPLPIDPTAVSAGSFLLELQSKAGTTTWPYLTVLAGEPTPTPTPDRPLTPSPTPTGGDPVPTIVPGPTDCNPLSVGQCVLPYPSMFHLEPDATSATGYRVNMPDDGLPGDNIPTRLEIYDGFSPTQAMLCEFPGAIDTAMLPQFEDLADTVAPTSPFLLMNAEAGHPNFGERVPLHVDYATNGTNTIVILRPAASMDRDSRYIVALRNLQQPNGNRVRTSPAFEALRDGMPVQGDTARVQALYENIFSLIEAQGWTRQELDLCWDFRTTSTTSVTGTMVHMVEEGLRQFNPAVAPLTLQSQNDESNGDKTFVLQTTVPSFVKIVEREMELDADFLPKRIGDRDISITVSVPSTVLNSNRKPAPVGMYGHGIFSSSSEINRNPHIRDPEFIGIAVDWEGFTSIDSVSIALEIIPQPITRLPRMIDRLQQSMANAVFVSEMLPQIATLLENELGEDVLDPNEFYFIGQSLGGVMGGVFMAVHPDVPAGALLVPGGGWSHILQRSVIWNQEVAGVSFRGYIGFLYPDEIDQQVLIALMQGIWDPIDPVTYAEHWAVNPLGNRQPRHILMQQGVPDGTVPNYSTEILMRNAELPFLRPVADPAQGIADGNPPTQGAGFGACTQYPGTGHGAGRSQGAMEEKRKFLWSFTRPGEGYGQPGNISGRPQVVGP